MSNNNPPTPEQGTDHRNTHIRIDNPRHERDRTPELRRDGPEDDLEL
jgi:hypothetical protein